MTQAVLHDGRVLEFPDGTDPAVIQATVKRVLAGDTPGGGEPAAARFTPEDIEAVIQQESGGRPDVLGPVQRDGQRAVGLMQVNPQTAASPGFGVPPIDPASLKDPEANRAFGVQYLNAMLDKFGDKKTALLAYNHGPGAVQELLDAGLPLTGLENFNYADEVLARVRQPQAAPAPVAPPVAPAAPPTPQAVPAGPDPRIAQAAADPFSPAAMARDAGRLEGVPAAPQTPEPESFAGLKAINRAGGVLGSGANRGVATVAGAPVELMNRVPQLLNLLPGEQGIGPISDRPTGGIADMMQLLEAMGLNQVKREDLEGFGERMLGRVGEELGGAAIPGGMMLKRAGKAATGGLLDKAFIEPLRRAPGPVAASEVALAGGAGVGAQVANEAFGSEPGDLGDLIGSLLGTLGTGGALTAARGAAVLGKQGIEVAAKAIGAGDPVDFRMRQGVGKMLAETATSPERLPARIAEGQVVAGEIPGLKPTAAEAAADPGLQALEFQRQSAGRAGDFRARRAENQAAIERELQDAAPEAVDDAATRAALEARRACTEKVVAKGTQRREGELAEAQAKVEPTQTRVEAGRDVRAEVEAARARLKLTREEQAQPDLQVALASEAEVDASGVVRLIDDKLKTTKRDVVINALKKVRQKLHKAADEVEPDADDLAASANFRALGGDDAPAARLDDTVAGLYETRKVINDLIAGKGEDSTSRFAQKELTEVKRALDDAINEAEPAFGDFLHKFREASIPISKIEEGATGAVLKRDKLTGTAAVPESEVSSVFIKSNKGSPEAIREFTEKVGGHDKAVAGLRQEALIGAKKAFEEGGEKGLRKWIKDHEDALSAFPETRRDLGSVADAKGVLDRAARREKMIKEGLNNPRKSTIAAYLDTSEAADGMKTILGSKKPEVEMKKLMRLIRGDKDAIEGAKRAFFDLFSADEPGKALGLVRGTAEDLTGATLFAPGKLKKFMRKYNPALKELFKDDPRQLERINNISAAIQRGASVARAKPPGTSGTPLGIRDTATFSLASALSRSFNVAKGVVSPAFVLTEGALRIGNKIVLRLKKRDFEALLDRALLDPEVAKTLVMEWNESTAKVVRRRLRLHLGRDVGAFAQTDESKE